MQVGKIDSSDLEKNFDGFYYGISGRRWDYVTKIIHNQEQIIRCQLRDGSTNPPAVVKYWNMDGTEAAQFTVGSGGIAYKQVLDITWLNNESKFCYVITSSGITGSPTATGTGYYVLSASADGSSPEVLIKNVSTAYSSSWATASVSGYVGIASSDPDLFLKIGPELYQVSRSALAGGDKEWSSLVAGGSVKSSSTCFHYGNGTECQNLMYQDLTPSGYVLYSWYDWGISALYLRSISVSGTSPTYLPNRWCMLNIPEYSSIRYPLFINRLDYDAIHDLKVATTSISGSTVTSGSTAYLRVFNVDESLAAFLNVNASDIVMPAGIGATSDIIATVANCWGTTLSGKLVQFWVSSGDGGVSPTTDYTDINGKAYTVFTTGANVGISNVAVVVNEI